MERKRQREIAIGGLAVAIVAIAIYRVSSFSGTPSNTELRPAAAAKPSSQSQIPQVPRVDLEALKGERPEPVDSPRNPFRFKPTPPPPPPVSTQPRPAPQVPTGPVEPPPPPPIPLKFIGVLEANKTGVIAILSDGRGIPISGKQGDIIEGRYRILRIGVESLDLAYLDGRGRQTIRLTGQ